MTAMLPGELVRALSALRDALVVQARLSALALLAEESLALQEERAAESVQRIEQAAQVQDLLRRYFGAREPSVAWQDGQRPDQLGLIPPDGPADRAKVSAALEAALLQLARRAHELHGKSAASPLCAPATALVAQLLATLPPGKPGAPLPRPKASPPAAQATRALRGPKRVHLDPHFAPAFSVLERPDLLVSHGDFDKAPFYWLASLRESMAAELCALSLVEYDGLPILYYRDFAKQAWDEVRHARYFLHVGLTLLPEFVASAPRGHPLLEGARRFLRTGRGLPCPIERNLYEVAWNATLAQRLVLMHLDTETPGIARFKQELRLPFWRARRELAKGLRLTTFDEATHARLGRAWLQHLLPDRAERRAEIARARLLRGAFLLAAFSYYHRRPFGELLRAASGAGP